MANLYEIPPGYETRMRILRAVNVLFKEYTLESITVAMICSEARVARQTFYRYFTDKFDAINWYHMLSAQQTLHQIGRTLTWHEGVLKMLEHVLEERNFYEKALRSSGDYASLANFSRRLNVMEFRKTVVEHNHLELTPELDFEIKLWGRTGAEAVAEWVLGGFVYTPSELATLLDECRPQRLQKAMDEPVLQRRASQSMG